MFAAGSLFLAIQMLVAKDMLMVRVWQEGNSVPIKMEIGTAEINTLNKYEKIEIMYNTLTLKKGMIQNLPKLKSLHIYFAKIKELPPGCFQNLPNLVDLVLENDQIGFVESGVFNDLKSISKLSLMMNEISYIESEAFGNMDSLHTLILDRNRLTNINKNWFKNCPNLTIISLRENSISEIPEDAFINLVAYERPLEIILSNNSIRYIHERAFRGFVYLEVLRLEDNQIAVIPDGIFDRFFMVRKLDLSFNKLKPHSERTFRKVKQLLVEGNSNIDCDFVKLFESYGQNKTIDVKEKCYVSLKY